MYRAPVTVPNVLDSRELMTYAIPCQYVSDRMVVIVSDELLGRAEASPTQVMSIEIFCLYIIYIYICRPSFRIQCFL